MTENEPVLRFQLWNPAGKLIASYIDLEKLPQVYGIRVTENYTAEGWRNVYRKNELGGVRIIARESDPMFAGSRGRLLACEIYLSLIPKFRQVETSCRQHYDSIIRRFAHNLIKFQARFKGNFSRLISDTARARPYEEFRVEVEKRIKANTAVAAHDVCQMSNRAVDLDAQIDTLRIISGYAENGSSDTKIKVDIQKAIYRLTNPFLEEFKEKGIGVIIDIPAARTGEEKILLEPNLFNAAIWQLLDNASKYTLSKTNLTIRASITGKPQQLFIEMTSVCIEKDELELIFLEGTKGKHSGTKGESGIGLYIVRKALGIMGAKIFVVNDGPVCEEKGFSYCKHKFVIEFS